MSKLRLLSLIIPTFNRHKFAIRSMQFWSGSPITVYVLDGSKTAIENKEICDLSDNIKYMHLPIPYEKRLMTGISKVKTQYCVMLSDDEFHLPTALNECILELENDHSLSA